MRRGVFVPLLVLGLLTPSGRLCAQAAIPGRSPLNFVVILMDDLGWKDVNCYGGTCYHTPHLDRMAREGMRFTNAYSACTVCSPTRASLLTGKYPARLHLTDYIGARPPANAGLRIPEWTAHLPIEEITLARALKPAGYVSACVGKWHLDRNPKDLAEGAGPYSPKMHGFDVALASSVLGQTPDYFYPYRRKVLGRDIQVMNLPPGQTGNYLTDKLTDVAEGFLEHNQARPFFLYLPYYAVHTAIGARLQGKPEKIAKYKSMKGDKAPKDPVYAAMVESMDENVGRILAKLSDLKMADRTLVIFTSDNGGVEGATSNRPLRGGKGAPYEGGVRVPLIVAGLGLVRAGVVSDVPVSSIDIYPTILDLAGLAKKQTGTIDGVSLVPLLTGKGALNDRPLFWHYPHYNEGRSPYGAVRQGNYKLIEFYEGPRGELYDLAADPGENRDLAGTEPGKAKELLKMLANWRRKVKAQMPVKKADKFSNGSG